MNGRSQIQGGKTWILPKEINKPVLLRLSLAGNLENMHLCDMSLYGIEWRERAMDSGRKPVFVNILRSPGIYSQPGGIESSECLMYS
jgi:hypothetical protein